METIKDRIKGTLRPYLTTWQSRAKKQFQMLKDAPAPTITETVDTDFIRVYSIEINKNCNLNCTMCNTQLSNRKQINMEIGLFEETLKQWKKHAPPGQDLGLHTIGEPLINPKLEEYFKLLIQYDVKITLSTNALFLKSRYELLKKYRDAVRTLRFSVDGATKESYELIRRPGKFDALLENLDYFTEANSADGAFDNLRLDSIVSTDTQAELAYHLDFYSRYVPMKNIGLYLVNGLSLDNSYFLEKTILKKYIVPAYPCPLLQGANGVVLGDGRVSGCCRDYNGELILGDLKKNTLVEIMNSPEAKALRKQHITGEIPEKSLCSSCYFMDHRVNGIFEAFTALMVERFENDWNIEREQARFDQFFALFNDHFATNDEIVDLLK